MLHFQSEKIVSFSLTNTREYETETETTAKKSRIKWIIWKCFVSVQLSVCLFVYARWLPLINWLHRYKTTRFTSPESPTVAIYRYIVRYYNKTPLSNDIGYIKQSMESIERQTQNTKHNDKIFSSTSRICFKEIKTQTNRIECLPTFHMPRPIGWQEIYHRQDIVIKHLIKNIIIFLLWCRHSHTHTHDNQKQQKNVFCIKRRRSPFWPNTAKCQLGFPCPLRSPLSSCVCHLYSYFHRCIEWHSL